jgi:hypothetical protein
MGVDGFHDHGTIERRSRRRPFAQRLEGTRVRPHLTSSGAERKNLEMERIASGDHHVSYKLGALTLTSLRDGYVDMPITQLRKPCDKIFENDLPTQTKLVNGKLRLSVNAFALDDGESVSLIDTGASNAWLPSMGLLPQALSEAKIAPERIRTVAFTHTHIDHINGLILPNGRDAFPQLSRLLVPKAELGLFRAEARLERFHGLSRDS